MFWQTQEYAARCWWFYEMYSWFVAAYAPPPGSCGWEPDGGLPGAVREWVIRQRLSSSHSRAVSYQPTSNVGVRERCERRVRFGYRSMNRKAGFTLWGCSLQRILLLAGETGK